jgi:predicted PurR-regulated permease PerM
MERRRWRRGIAIAVIYLLFLFIGAMIVRGINALASSDLVALLQSVIPAEFLKGSPQDIARAATHWVNVHHVPNVLRRPILAQAGHIPEIANRFIQWTTANLPALAESLMWLVLVPVLAFFILLDFHKIIGKIFILIPKERREGLLTVVTEIIAVLGNYVRGVLLVMVLDMVVIYIVLQFSGLSRYAFVLAVTAGLFYTVPYLGAVVSTFLIGLTTLAVTHSTEHALGVTAIMIFIHQIVFDNIVAPRVIGGSVNLHPLLTLLTLLSAGTLFGMWGVLLGVPVAAAVQVILINLFPQLKTDDRIMLKAEHAVKATLSTESEATKPEARKTESVPELKKEEGSARRDVEQDLTKGGAH